MSRSVDKIIWIATICILGIGLVTLYSASYQNTRVAHEVFYDQLVCAAIGLVLMGILSRMDYRRFYDLAYVFYWLSVGLLVLVMLTGRHALGATRWLTILGISFQPSELAKLALIFVLARYFGDRKSMPAFSQVSLFQMLWRQLFFPLLITLVPMLLIFKQPDLGTSVLLFSIFLFMLFVSSIRYRYFAGFLMVCLMFMPLGWHVLKPYQKDRLLVFMNPNIDPLGAGYTIIQSKIAVGSGQLFGKGWLAGTQNQLNFLPERHTDFIFSVVGEEWGLMGTGFLLFSYFMLILAGLKIASQVKDGFGMQLTIGIVAILGAQVIINMGMVLGLLPVVGVTLPLVSYGRSSFMVSMTMLGILLSLSRRRTIF